MKKPNISITVIIPTLSRSKSVRRLLGSLARQTRLPDQIVIVDASEDHDTETVVQTAEPVLHERLEYYRTERGLTRQRNFGLQKTTGEIIGFLDDDVVLDESYLTDIVKPFGSDPENKIGGTTGFVYPTPLHGSALHKAVVKLIQRISGPRCFARHYGIRLIPAEPFVQRIPIRYVSGCNMFFRRDVFERFRFDEWFEGYGLGEDREFGLRVSQKWKIMAVGTARLHHLHEPAGRPDYLKLGKMFIENPARILTIARHDRIVFNESFLIGRQLLGGWITSLGMALSGRRTDAFWYAWGGLLGFMCACRFVRDYLWDSNKL
jgi:GT2 family glycosyltransferase